MGPIITATTPLVVAATPIVVAGARVAAFGLATGVCYGVAGLVAYFTVDKSMSLIDKVLERRRLRQIEKFLDA